MLWYVVKLILLLPIIGALIWGSMKLLQKLQARVNGPTGAPRAVRIVETTMLSPTLKLAVLEFRGREILVSASKNGLVRLAEVPMQQEPSE
jgi:flagellar protein FliO/FliZ